MPGHTMEVIDGHRWYYWKARHCDEYITMPVLVTMRWFLKDGSDWVGDFPTKRELLEWIEEYGQEWIAEFNRE